MECKVTYPKGHGAAKKAPGVGTIQPGETKTVKLSEELYAAYAAPDCVFEVAQAAGPKKAKKKSEE